MPNVISFRKPLVVTVTHDVDVGMWVASCDALYLATEADSFEALTIRVREIAPDLIADNGLNLDPATLQLDFQYIQKADDRIAL